MQWLLGALLALAVPGCRFDIPEVPDDEAPSTRLVRGTVVDFESGQPIVGAASVITSGLIPVPTITSTGAAFTIQEVPENSVASFRVIAERRDAPDVHPTRPLIARGYCGRRKRPPYTALPSTWPCIASITLCRVSNASSEGETSSVVSSA